MISQFLKIFGVATTVLTLACFQGDRSRILRRAVGQYAGINTKMNTTGAKKIFLDAAETGDSLAIMWVARNYHKGRCDFELNPLKAQSLAASVIDRVKDLARKGDPEAMFLLGSAYADGLGVEANGQDVVHWFNQAARLGNTLAMNNLGYMYHSGDGVTQNYRQALQWYRKAAQKGDSLAMINLGRMYEKGKGASQNCQKSIYWFQKAAKFGQNTAMKELGYMYEHGICVPMDFVTSSYWYKKAAEDKK